MTYIPAGQPGGMGYCGFFAAMASDELGITTATSAEPPLGASVDFASEDPVRLNASAIVAPDCDRDGLGDETQDADTSACLADTVSPDTAIDDWKVKKKKK